MIMGGNKSGSSNIQQYGKCSLANTVRLLLLRFPFLSKPFKIPSYTFSAPSVSIPSGISPDPNFWLGDLHLQDQQAYL